MSVYDNAVADAKYYLQNGIEFDAQSLALRNRGLSLKEAGLAIKQADAELVLASKSTAVAVQETPTTPDEESARKKFDEEFPELAPAKVEEPVAEPPFFQSIAIPLAKRGLKVMPVNGKQAFLPNHPAQATSDVEKIVNEWKQYGDCNVAVHCRQEDGGAVIVDVDGADTTRV